MMEDSNRGPFYIVKVPKGKETDLMFLIRTRVELYDLPIYSVFAPEDQEGIVFIETDDYKALIQAVRYFRGVQVIGEPLEWDDVKEYLKVFLTKYEIPAERGAEEEVRIEPNMIVEIIDGPFQGQRGRVVSVKKNKVWVDLHARGAMLVPLSYDQVKPVED